MKFLKPLIPDTKIKLVFIALYILIDLMVFIVCYHSISKLFIEILPCSSWYISSIFLSFIVVIVLDGCEGEFLIFHSMAIIFLATNILLIFCYYAPATPFSNIDPWLYRMDSLLGFHLDVFVIWASEHTHWQKILNFSYETLFYQMSFVVLVLGCFGNRHSLRQYILAFIICAFLGSTFYFFFPSLNPSLFYKNLEFSKTQLHACVQFFQLRNHQSPKSHFLGIIGFPSFHIIYALFILYYSRQHKLFFYPILLLNIFLMASTLTTGWHFLTDVLGGFIFGAIAIISSHLISKYYVQENDVDLKPLWRELKPLWQKYIAIAVQLLALIGILISSYEKTNFPLWIALVCILLGGSEWRKLLKHKK